jgi:DNA polymerase III epsilon subunit-like protein
MVADAPLFPDVAAKVLEMIDGAVLICHNASFDISFLTCELNRAGIDLPDLRVIDTLRLARQHFSFPSNSLGNIADYLDIQVREQHRAMGDVRTTHQVFLHFHEELVRQGLTDIEALISSYKVLPARTENKSIAGLPPQLEEAMRSGRDINLWYVSRDGYETQRIVKPLRIVSSFDYLYLEAFCEIRHERRTFRLDRVVKMELVA